MPRSLFARAAELEDEGRSFAVATVVAVRRPTSARPGASGIVHPDGSIEGWVGGSCAQPVVVREALRSIADAQPRLLRLSKDGPGEGRRADGVIELVTCPDHPRGCLAVQGALACGDDAVPAREQLVALRAAGEALLRRRLEKAKADGDLPAGGLQPA